MSVVRVNKSREYTVMSNYHLRDLRLSLKAKGLLSQILSLPDNWNYTVAGLVEINKENETAINSTLNELKQCGYLVVTKLMPNQTKTGRIEYVYDIYEKSLNDTLEKGKEQEGEKQDLEILGVEVQGIENRVQLNTNIQNTELQNTENKNSQRKNVKKESSKTFTVPTVEEVAEYCNERNNNIDAEAFIDYYTARNWMIGKTKMHDWKAAIRTWERRKKDSSSNQTNEQDSVIERLNSLSYKDIETYCKAQNYTHVNAMEFLSNYRKRNWKVGNTVITDWHSAVDEWEARELRKIKEKQDEEYKIYHRSYMDRCLNRR